jgi:uncharacterized phiE125 gp8 family phage protein
MLNERTTVPDAALPVAEFRDHLRLGTGFADDAVQDGRLAGCLRAAMVAIEGRTGKVLIAREFTWAVTRWRESGAQPLPVAPVSELTEMRLVPRTGAPVVVDPARYRLEPDLHKPLILPGGIVLPSIPTGGRIEVDFIAGFGPAWGEVSADLRQAVLMLAAQYYEARDGQTDRGELPMGVSALIARWRTLRTLGGGAR